MNNMQDHYNGYQENAYSETVVKRIMAGVYGWMAFALIISAIVGLYIASNRALLFNLFNTRVYWVFAIAEIVAVMAISARTHKMSPGAAKVWFVIYAALNGITFGGILAAYGFGLAVYAFLATAIVFAVMTVYGYVTKTDLSTIGNLFFMALIGLVIVTLMNVLFIHSAGIELGILYIGVIIFIGLIGYDTQKIKQFAYAESQGIVKNASILGALTLYLDFINIFLSIVRIMGRDD